MRTVAFYYPFQRFREWFEAAKLTEVDATAMTLATSEENAPNARMVLLKHFDEQGFVFYTNLNSTKAKTLQANPQASLCFYWPVQQRQIRIQGNVEMVDPVEADRYFASRPRGSQIGAWASKQTQPLADPDELAQRIKKFTKQFGEGPIPRPDFWSGYRVIPHTMEFWQAGTNRLHQRWLYKQQPTGDWQELSLYP